MSESVRARAERFARAYKGRRWRKSRKSDGFPWDDVVIGVLSAIFGVLASPASETWTKVFIGGVTGLLAVAIWHLILTPIWRFVFVVPVEEHVAQAEQIYERNSTIQQIEKQLRIAEANVVTARDRQGVLDRLNQFSRDGAAYLQFAQRGEPLPVFTGYIQKWEREASGFLREQIGADAWQRFANANNPVVGNSVTIRTPTDHAGWAQRVRGQLECLDALSRRLQNI